MEPEYYKEYLENKKRNRERLKNLTQNNLQIQGLYYKVMGMNEYNKDECELNEEK